MILWLNYDMTGLIPSSLGNLTNLRVLGLQGDFTGSIPSSLGNLRNLEDLYIGAGLNGTRLRGSIPSSLSNLTKLWRLNIGSTDHMTGSIPLWLGDLTNLQHLNLRGNVFTAGGGWTGPIPSSLGNLTNLVNLELSDNDLTGPIPSSLGNLTNLVNLYLHRNDLSGSIPSSMGRLTNLQELYLHNNQLLPDSMIPAGLCEFESTINPQQGDVYLLCEGAANVAGSLGALRCGCQGRGKQQRHDRLHGDPGSGGERNGQRRLRHRGRQRAGGRGLHGHERDADLRAGRALQDGPGGRPRRRARRGRGDLHARAVEAVGSGHRRWGGDGTDREPRSTAAGAGGPVRSDGGGARGRAGGGAAAGAAGAGVRWPVRRSGVAAWHGGRSGPELPQPVRWWGRPAGGRGGRAGSAVGLVGRGCGVAWSVGAGRRSIVARRGFRGRRIGCDGGRAGRRLARRGIPGDGPRGRRHAGRLGLRAQPRDAEGRRALLLEPGCAVELHGPGGCVGPWR